MTNSKCGLQFGNLGSFSATLLGSNGTLSKEGSKNFDTHFSVLGMSPNLLWYLNVIVSANFISNHYLSTN